MLAKKTETGVTLPEQVLEQLPTVDYFDVSVEGGAVVLRPVQPEKADLVHSKLAELGIEESDIEDAIQWARRQSA